MKSVFALILFIVAGETALHAQSEYLKWKPLVINQTQRIWYDASSIDTVDGDKFKVWILQMYQPPLSFDGIADKIYRSRTQYGIDLNTEKYGILKVIYYGVTNNVLYNFDYHIDNYPDNLKYTYPLMENSYMKILIQKLGRIQDKGIN